MIPAPEDGSEAPAYGIKPGYYNSNQMVDLINQYKTKAAAIQFIADMLETGDPQIDGFADMLRANNINSSALGRIAEQCRAQAAHRSGSA